MALSSLGCEPLVLDFELAAGVLLVATMHEAARPGCAPAMVLQPCHLLLGTV